MKQTVSKSIFIDQFNAMRPGQFTNSGLEFLFDYLEETDEDMELDVIGLCCDFSEYDTATAAAKDNGWTEYEGEKWDEDTMEEQALEWLQSKTSVIQCDGSVIIASF